MNTVGLYVPGTSLPYRIPAGVKLLALLGTVTVLVVLADPWVSLGAVLAVVLLYILWGLAAHLWHAFRPVLLFLTSKGDKPGPASGPRTWRVACWRGKGWELGDVTTSDHNYDHGSLYLEKGGIWRLIAPTEPGPVPHATGGDLALWLSRDAGKSWKKEKVLTRGPRTHTYARRPVNAHPDFYALWADGNPLEPSPSALYFTNREGEKVWKLPEAMTEEFARPCSTVGGRYMKSSFLRSARSVP